MAVRGKLRMERRALSAEDTEALLRRAPVMRLATVDGDGWPYVIPMSFTWRDGKAYFHHTPEDSHLTECLRRDPRVCIEVDDGGTVVAGGGTACDLDRVYRSAVAFGRAALVTDAAEKERAFRVLLEKYAPEGSGLPTSYTSPDKPLVFEITAETVTGKQRQGG